MCSSKKVIQKIASIVLLQFVICGTCDAQRTNIFQLGYVHNACKVSDIKIAHTENNDRFNFLLKLEYANDRITNIQQTVLKNDLILRAREFSFHYDDDRLKLIEGGNKRKSFFYDELGDLIRVEVTMDSELLNYTLFDYRKFASNRSIGVQTFSTSRGNMKLYADYRLYLDEDDLVEKETIAYFNYGRRSITSFFEYDGLSNPLYQMNLTSDLSSGMPTDYLSKQNCTLKSRKGGSTRKRIIYNDDNLPVLIEHKSSAFKTYQFEYNCQSI